jgi:hypothetical protein
MPEKKVLTDDFHEEKLNIESTGRYRVTHQTRVRKEKGYSIIHFVPTRQGKRPVRSIKGIANVSGRVEYSRSRRVARRIFDLQTPGSKKPPRAIAERWMRAFASELGIRKDLSGLHYDRTQKTKTSIFGRHVLYQQYVGQTPISGAWIRVDIDDDGRVFNIQNDLVPTATLARRGRAAGMKSRLQGDEEEPIAERLARRIALDLTRVNKGGKRRQTRTHLPTDRCRAPPCVEARRRINVTQGRVEDLHRRLYRRDSLATERAEVHRAAGARVRSKPGRSTEHRKTLRQEADSGWRLPHRGTPWPGRLRPPRWHICLDAPDEASRAPT